MEFKTKFEDLSAYYDEIGISNIISWNEGIQYLDYNILPSIKKVSLNALLKGEYKSIATDKPNSINTEKTYSNRIKFFARTFPSLNMYTGIEFPKASTVSADLSRIARQTTTPRV
jgi:hypothetical protein